VIERVLFDTDDPNLPSYLRGKISVVVVVRDPDAYYAEDMRAPLAINYTIYNVVISPRITIKLLDQDLARIGGATVRAMGASGSTSPMPGYAGIILAVGRGRYYLATLYRCCYVRLSDYGEYAVHCEPADNEQGQAVRGLIGVITDMAGFGTTRVQLSELSDLVNMSRGLQQYNRVVVDAHKTITISSEWIDNLNFRFYPLPFVAAYLFNKLSIPWWMDPVLSQIVDVPVAVEITPVDVSYSEVLSLYNGDDGPLAVYIHRSSSSFTLVWAPGNAAQARTMYIEVRRS